MHIKNYKRLYRALSLYLRRRKAFSANRRKQIPVLNMLAAHKRADRIARQEFGWPRGADQHW